jgi:hypothetical protein
MHAKYLSSQFAARGETGLRDAERQPNFFTHPQVVTFDVAAGDKKYVKLSYGFSFNTYPELVDSATGEAESSELSYIRQK